MQNELNHLLDIEKLNRLLDNTLENQEKAIRYLLDLYESTECHKREIALNLKSYEYFTNEEIYKLTGIECIKYSVDLSLITLIGNTDMLLRFPHLVYVYDNLSIYSFEVNSVGSLKIKDIKSKYTFFNSFEHDYNDEVLAKLKKENSNYLNYNFDLTYLFDMDVEFGPTVRFTYLKENINDFMFNYIVDDMDSLNDMIYTILSENTIYDTSGVDLDSIPEDELDDYLYENCMGDDIVGLTNYSLNLNLSGDVLEHTLSPIMSENLIELEYLSNIFKDLTLYCDIDGLYSMFDPELINSVNKSMINEYLIYLKELKKINVKLKFYGRQEIVKLFNILVSMFETK